MAWITMSVLYLATGDASGTSSRQALLRGYVVDAEGMDQAAGSHHLTLFAQ
jgi:hypothetical protein